jgi:hypothetical protein
MPQVSLLMIDDFYRDPERLRQEALQLDFSSQALNLPASRSTETIVTPEVTDIFRTTLGVNISEAALRIPLNGCFQLMTEKDQARSYVHADQSAQWAAIIYLSSPPLSKKAPSTSGSHLGTIFYRHRLTGLTRFPQGKNLDEWAKELDLTPEELMLLLREDRKDKKKWIETDQIEFRWNRFILYDAQLFHCNGPTWGKSVTTGRLTHNFFV